EGGRPIRGRIEEDPSPSRTRCEHECCDRDGQGHKNGDGEDHETYPEVLPRPELISLQVHRKRRERAAWGKRRPLGRIRWKLPPVNPKALQLPFARRAPRRQQVATRRRSERSRPPCVHGWT